jgi:hypothetical protein
MSRFTTFLKTTTGIVTAITTLLVAIAGLVTAVKQLGGEGKGGGSPPAAATAQRTSSGYSVYPPELRSAIPTKVLPTCGPPKYPEETAVAATNCKYREVVNLQYNLFASEVELRQNVANVRKRYGDKHACGKKPLLCFVQDNGEADIVWIDEPNRIMAFAYRDDGNLDALYESWREIAE